MAESVLYASFIVRLWRDPPTEGADAHGPAWMGELESIQTGRAWRFQGLDPLPGLLAAQVGDDSPAGHGRKKFDFSEEVELLNSQTEVHYDSRRWRNGYAGRAHRPGPAGKGQRSAQ
jgi:hypothetical protein